MSYTFSEEGTVTAPGKGSLRATGVHCGLKSSRSRDLGLLVAFKDCSAAGHFGSASGPAGAWSMAALRRNPTSLRAVIILSGIAGGRGGEAVAACDELAAFFADEAMLKSDQVLILAAGAMAPLPLEMLKVGLPRALDELYSAGGQRLAAAMALTDEEPTHVAGCTIVANPPIELGAVGVPQSKRLIISTDVSCSPQELQTAVDSILQAYPDLDTGSLLVLSTNGRAALTKPEHAEWHKALLALVQKVIGE